jgi:multiple sugar transport system substrate-binding protein
MSARKLVAVAGALTVAVSLAACGGGSSGGGGGGHAGQTLQVYLSRQASYPNEQQQWMQHVKDEFTKKTGASVEFETYSSATEEQQKIQTSVVSGQGPDIYEIGTTFTPTAYSSGAFLKLGDEQWNAVGGRDRFVPSTLAMSGPDEVDQIAVPFSSLPFVLVYNTQMFTAAGIGGPPSTWDELVADAKKLTHGDTFGLAMDYKDPFSPWKYVWMFAQQYGNPLVQGTTARIDDPTVARAYDAYFGFLTEDRIVNPDAANWASADATANFASGKSAMFAMTSASVIPTLAKSPVANSYAFAPMPTVPPGESALPAGGVPATTIVSGQNLVVASYSTQQDLALQYVELVTSEAEQQHFSEVFGVLPTNAAAADAIASGKAQYAPVLEAGKQAKPTPFTGAWSEIQLGLTNITVQSLAGLSAGSVPPDQVQRQLADLQKTAQAAVDKAAAAR